MSAFWTTRELLARGKSRADIRAAAASGLILPVRQGHWAAPGAREEVVRAARVGGVATATSASRSLGLWTPPDALPQALGSVAAPGGGRRPPPRLHVAVADSCGRLRDPDDAGTALRRRPDVVIHYVAATLLVGSARSRIAGIQLVLRHVFATQPPERALAVLDSALRQRLIRPGELAALESALPQHLRRVVDGADGRADSGIETIVRHLLRARGLRVEVQPRLEGIGAVDLLVEGRLIIECDGREFHDDVGAFERDRRRDLGAALGRYRVLRLTWNQVLHHWEDVEAAIFAALV